MTVDQWASLRSTLSEYITAGYGPFFVRQAYADAATGGGGHAQRWAIDRKSFNDRDLAMVDGIKAKFPDITLADLVSFAGALSVTAMGGPTINWRAGRNDAKTALDAPINLNTSSAKATDGVDELRAFFTDRLGLSDRDIVALLGAHNLGNCHIWKSGYAGPWSSTPFNLTNEYFQLLQYPDNYTTEFVLSASGTKMQFIDNSGRMMLPVDIALTKDETFFTIVQEYAANQATFFADFASAYGRLLETTVATGLSKNVVSTSLAVAASTKPFNGICYPNTGNPIFCVEQFDDGKGNVIFTVHTNRQGWVGLGVGSGSMVKNDVIVGYASQSGIGGVQTSRFRTVQHKVIPNTKSAWQQIPLHPSSNKPSWSNISFSAVHRKVIESTTGIVGNNLNGFLTFAVSDFAPEKDTTSVVDGVTTLYQHDISAILVRGTGGATMIVGDESTATPMSVGVIAGIAAGAAVAVILAVLAVVFRKRIFGRREKHVPTTLAAPEAPVALPETLQHHSDAAWLKSQYAAGPLTVGSQSSAGDSAPPSFLPDVTYHQIAAKSEKQSQLFSAFGPVTLGSPSDERNRHSNLPSISGASGTAYSVNEVAENAAFEQKLKQYLDGNITPPQEVSSWDRAAVAYFVMKNGGSLVSAARVRDENLVGAVLLAPTFTIPDLTFALAIEKLGDKVIFETAMLALRERNGGVRKHEPPAYI
ncbi:L-ascorbate peroxidase 3 [Chytriomyces hyalinus]|nr:L-ascorbate peroxidase 3 [Chytriomyces hyalinus]